MTDKEKIRTEIERLKKDWQCYLRYSVESKYRTEAYSELLDFIDSLPEEPVSEDLEEAAIQFATDTETGKVDVVKQGSFYWGAIYHKQQMMANAVDIEVKLDAGGYPYIPQMELYDYEKDVPLAKEGDKYKVILIKEE